jgi:hypothetical protein
MKPSVRIQIGRAARDGRFFRAERLERSEEIARKNILQSWAYPEFYDEDGELATDPVLADTFVSSGWEILLGPDRLDKDQRNLTFYAAIEQLKRAASGL